MNKKEQIFNHFTDEVVEGSREKLNKYGSVNPHIIVKVPKEKSTYLVPLEGNKHRWKKQITKIVNRAQASHYAVVVEGWAAPSHKKLSPSQHPRREDVVFITIYSKDGKRIMIAIEFKPITSKQVAIGTVETWTEFDDYLVGDVFEKEVK